MNKIELLAPAGNFDCLIAAVQSGADAVYLSGKSFGARSYANNFDKDELIRAVDYCHLRGVKVYVTLNTLVSDGEIEKLIKLVDVAYLAKVDAFIIQDMGLLKELIEISQNKNIKLPSIHISTQCDNFLPQKISFFNDIGVSRVVLARELSIEQIKHIHKENPNLELEAFIHGALCVSMSGQCYLSQYIGGRSANRGECAQPCRKKYTVETTNNEIIKENFYALSLKDFNASENLDELKNAGICSFKIEGRLKDISYVKNIVTYYKQKLGKTSSSGTCTYQFIPNPHKTFNRGFTSYFLKKRTECYNQESPKSKGEYLGEVVDIKKDCFKINSSKKIIAQDGIYSNNNGFAVNKVVNNYIYPNKKINLKLGDKIWRNYDVKFEKDLLKKHLDDIVNSATAKKYPELFYYFEGLVGTKIKPKMVWL